MTTQYFTSTAYNPPALLRRNNYVDEAFVNDVWRPTRSIMDWMVGSNDAVHQITEDEAKIFAPKAFI